MESAMQAQDIMSKNPRTVTPEATVREAARLMQEEDVGIVPVVESDRLVGLITDRDIAIRVVAEGRAEARVRDVMSENPKSCRPGDDINEVLEMMGREKVRRVPITDERGTLLGIVAQADVVREGPSDKRAEATIEQISTPGGRHSQ